MADFPQRNKSFDPMAYRSQAAYDASMSRRQSKEQHFEPAKSFHPMAYRSQAAFDASRGQSKEKYPEPAKSFNRMAYRSQAAYNAWRGRPNKKDIDSTKSQQPRAAQKTIISQQHHPNAKKTTTSKEQTPSDDLHVMTDAEVKQWFAEAEADYEAAKKRGEFDNYVPAAGRAPDFSKFRQQFDVNGKPVKGLANSRHARKAPEDDEPVKK